MGRIENTKIKMTNQNAKILAFASSLREAFFPCHREAGEDSRSNLGEETGDCHAPYGCSQ